MQNHFDKLKLHARRRSAISRVVDAEKCWFLGNLEKGLELALSGQLLLEDVQLEKGGEMYQERVKKWGIKARWIAHRCICEKAPLHGKPCNTLATDRARVDPCSSASLNHGHLSPVEDERMNTCSLTRWKTLDCLANVEDDMSSQNNFFQPEEETMHTSDIQEERLPITEDRRKVAFQLIVDAQILWLEGKLVKATNALSSGKWLIEELLDIEREGGCNLTDSNLKRWYVLVQLLEKQCTFEQTDLAKWMPPMDDDKHS